MFQKQYKTIIQAKQLNKIAYCDEPLTSSSQITYLTLQEYEQKFNCIYHEGLLAPPGKFDQYLNNAQINESIKVNKEQPNIELVKHRLNNPLSCLVICKINDEVGHGLFTNEDIPAGTVLFLYSGVIKKAKPYNPNNNYHYAWLKNENLAVDPKSNGGLARFMQHLPYNTDRYKKDMKENLLKHFGSAILKAKKIDLDAYVNELAASSNDDEYDNLAFPADIKAQLATSNVKPALIVLEGIPTLIFWNEREIKKGQIGFSYGKNYWEQNNIKPRYFTLSGEMLPRSFQSSHQAPFILLPAPSINPFTLYQQAISFYKNNEYAQAIEMLQNAIKEYQSQPETAIKIFTCYSTLASCYRELSDYLLAADACIKAMNYLVPENVKEQETIYSKYHAILSKQNLTADVLYKEAISYFKDKKYNLVKSQLMYCLEKWQVEQPIPHKKLAVCYSTLVSCCRELGEINKGLEYCDLAMSFANGDADMTAKISAKKEQLENLTEKLASGFQNQSSLS